MPKGIRNVSLTSIPGVKEGYTVATDDLADRDHFTSAVASPDHLVTSEILRAPQEDVVLSAEGDADARYINELKFNEEIVEITIAEDSSEFPIDPVYVSCNGKEAYIRRGVPTKIQRKFVECLCSPLVRVDTRQTKNNLGEDATELVQRRSLQFPFQLNDANPRGREWLRALLRR